MKYAHWKRAFDISFSLLGIVLSAPFMTLIALAVRLESMGHPIFVQTRIGKGGKTFRMYKFRKFPADMGALGPMVSVASDVRMTRVGAFLEKTKLNELPQLWNILNGDMSFVGPRPESLRFAQLLQEKHPEVLRHKPGVFGPSQVYFRNEANLFPPDEDPEVFYTRELLSKKAETDIAYYANATVFSDLYWMFKGLWETVAHAVDWKRFLQSYGKLLVLDVCVVLTAWTFAYVVTLPIYYVDPPFQLYIHGLWICPLVVTTFLFLFGCYHHPLKLFSLSDAFRLFLVGALAWLFLNLILFFHFAEDTPFMYMTLFGCMVCAMLLNLPRILYRIAWERSGRHQKERCPRVLIYGAGRAGISLARWMKFGSVAKKLVGFLDDDPGLLGKRMDGLRILGCERDLPTARRIHDVSEVWVTFPLEEQKRRRLESLCAENNVRLHVLADMEPLHPFWAGVGDSYPLDIPVAWPKLAEQHREGRI